MQFTTTPHSPDFATCLLGHWLARAHTTKKGRFGQCRAAFPTGCNGYVLPHPLSKPEQNRVVLENGNRLEYRALIVCPGLTLDWAGIEGLPDALGKNGVTSNYRYDLAPYTWALVQQRRSGQVIFTQPPLPIKCAGAPQKAMYLSCDHWQRTGVLDNIDVEFDNAGAVLFGVSAYVPILMKYVGRYGIKLAFGSNLKAVDGPAQKVWFDVKGSDGAVKRVEKSFDMLHVVPPQRAPDFVRSSPLANGDGWIEVDQATLRHTRFENIFSAGDVCSAPNAKTVAAARKQVVVVAENLLAKPCRAATTAMARVR